MSVPVGIRLNPGQLVLENTGSVSSGITPATPTSISGGIVRQAYSNQMMYSVGQTVIFFNSKATFFNQSDVTYVIVNQNDVSFQSEPVP